MEFDSFVLAASVSDLSAAARAREHADAVEFRMDLATDPLAELAGYDGALPVLATNRLEAEGGAAAAGPDRLAALSSAAECDAVAAIDVELATATTPEGRELLSSAADAGVDVVVSAHDFEGTPTPPEMRSTLEAASDAGRVGKLAVTAEDRGDVLDLLTVTHELAGEDRAVATMAMGEAGRHSRAVAPLYGSRIGYAPVDPAAATAPGQYDVAALSELLVALW
jgi:3-dehydroquinate dehydratase-1